jgi:hypothetical protein
VNHELCTVVSCIRKIISAVNRVDFESDRMSYRILRGRWCRSTVLDFHVLTENKTDD